MQNGVFVEKESAVTKPISSIQYNKNKIWGTLSKKSGHKDLTLIRPLDHPLVVKPVGQ
jgi:hypothetical protein